MWWRTWTVLRAYFSSSPKNVNPVYTPTVTGWTGRTSRPTQQTISVSPSEASSRSP